VEASKDAGQEEGALLVYWFSSFAEGESAMYPNGK
jgi:hypothetical protein